MRDQLEEAHKHRDDGYGRAQHLNQVELPKRFYATVDVARGEDGFAVRALREFATVFATYSTKRSH